MAVQTVTLHLPEEIMRRAQEAAQTLETPVEDILIDILAAALPNVDDVSPELQAELARMSWQSDAELWAIAQGEMVKEEQERLRELSKIQS
jgi:hypothetical protein